MPTKRKQHTPGKPARTARSGRGTVKRTGASGFSTSQANRVRSQKPSSSYTARKGSQRGGVSRESLAGNTLSGGANSFKHRGSSASGNRGGLKDAASNLPQPTLTRRNLLIGVGALAGVAAVGGGASAAINALDSSDEDTIESISVPTDAVESSDDYEQAEFDTYASIIGTFKLASGSQVWADTDTVAACLIPAETSSPLNTVSLLYLSSGNDVTVLEGAQSADEGYEIFDVRCSEEGMVWTEINTYESAWRIYTAQTTNGTADNILLVDEGDSNWMTPSIAAAGRAAFWQVMPVTDGENADDASELRAVKFGKEKYKSVCTSKRAFATRVTPATDGVVVTPLANTTSSYYTLKKISSKDFSTVDEMTLPSSMTPNMVSYGTSGFSFAFSDIYQYGDGIANLGTYTPRSKVKAHNYTDLPWFRFGRTPLASPCWCGDWFVVKSTTVICGINFANKCYFTTSNVNNADDYGEYLVSSGTCSNFVGVAQVTPDDEDAFTQVRVFAPLDGAVDSLFA